MEPCLGERFIGGYRLIRKWGYLPFQTRWNRELAAAVENHSISHFSPEMLGLLV
jgi:hypothetical protein